MLVIAYLLLRAYTLLQHSQCSSCCSQRLYCCSQLRRHYAPPASSSQLAPVFSASTATTNAVPTAFTSKQNWADEGEVDDDIDEASRSVYLEFWLLVEVELFCDTRVRPCSKETPDDVVGDPKSHKFNAVTVKLLGFRFRLMAGKLLRHTATAILQWQLGGG